MSTDPDELYSHSTSDGMVEVLGIVSSFHIAQLQMGLSKPVRLGQAKLVKVRQVCIVICYIRANIVIFEFIIFARKVGS